MFFLKLIWSVLNSEFFAGFATLVTAFIAYIIWLQQKEEEKVKAAKIILVEIIDCENLFDNIKINGINLTSIRQLPFENSWNKYKHLFAKTFDGRDLRLVDNFFNTCILINKELSEAYSLPDLWREKSRIIIERFVQYSEESQSKQEYESKKQKIKFFEEDEYWWQPFGPSKLIVEQVKLLQYITTTSVGEKLKKMAKYKNL